MKQVMAPFFLAAPLLAGFPSSQQALAQAFPGTQLTRREYFLTEPQGRQVKDLAGTELSGLWVVAYEARRDGKLKGIGFFDTHRVRTLNEPVVVAFPGEGHLQSGVVVEFKEPMD